MRQVVFTSRHSMCGSPSSFHKPTFHVWVRGHLKTCGCDLAYLPGWLAGAGWSWLELAGAGWSWLELAAAGCGWLRLAAAGCGCLAGWSWLVGWSWLAGAGWLIGARKHASPARSALPRVVKLHQKTTKAVAGSGSLQPEREGHCHGSNPRAEEGPLLRGFPRPNCVCGLEDQQ